MLTIEIVTVITIIIFPNVMVNLETLIWLNRKKLMCVDELIGVQREEAADEEEN